MKQSLYQFKVESRYDTVVAFPEELQELLSQGWYIKEMNSIGWAKDNCWHIITLLLQNDSL